MSKDFKNTAAAGAARFISVPDHQEAPPHEAPEFYRLNLKLDGALREYLSDEAWMKRTSITALVNQILIEYKDAHPHGNGNL